jgi:predicted transcriptional regulator
VANVVQTTIRLDEDLLKRVQMEKINRKTSVTEAIHEGLRWWLGEERPPAREECILTGLAEQHRKTLIALAWLMREGHEAEMVEIVRRVIAVAEKKARKDA